MPSPLLVILSPFAVILSAAKNLALLRVNFTKNLLFSLKVSSAKPLLFPIENK